MEKILIIDDEDTSIMVIKGFLDQDYDIEVGRNGKEAMELAEKWLPDLILLDVIMPDMSGMEVCKKLRGNSILNDPSIIMVTSKVEDSALQEGLESGAADYIKKPFSGIELRARVESALKLRASLRRLQEVIKEKEEVITRLQEAKSTVKTLSDLLPMCSNCKKIRNDDGYWKRLEEYLRDHADVMVTHGICDDCARELYPEFFDK